MTIHKHMLAPLRGEESQQSLVSSSNSEIEEQAENTYLKRSFSSLYSNYSNTTPEYSPQLITSEVGKLLSVKELDLLNESSHHNQTHLFNHRRKPSTKFDFISDDELDDVSSTDYDSDANVEPYMRELEDLAPLKRISTSTHCGESLNAIPKNYNDPNWDFNTKWAIVLIGLPASGKSTVIRHLIEYVKEMTDDKIRMKSFNAGDVRRRHESQNEKFDFDFSNKSSLKIRDYYAFEALNDLTGSLIKNEIDIGIFDATNTTRERRRAVFDRIEKASEDSNITLRPILLEVKCQNRALRRFNIEQKAHNNDYKDMPKDIAIVDFLKRIKKYEDVYECVTIEEISTLNVKYFGINNVGDAIYYDCGLKHHDSKRHQQLSFRYLALNLLYEFLMSYRERYAKEYLDEVRIFYNEGHYKPVNSPFSQPVTVADRLFKSYDNMLPKVLSSPRLN